MFFFLFLFFFFFFVFSDSEWNLESGRSVSRNWPLTWRVSCERGHVHHHVGAMYIIFSIIDVSCGAAAREINREESKAAMSSETKIMECSRQWASVTVVLFQFAIVHPAPRSASESRGDPRRQRSKRHRNRLQPNHRFRPTTTTTQQQRKWVTSQWHNDDWASELAQIVPAVLKQWVNLEKKTRS